MPQGLGKAPAIFNRIVSQILRPLCHFAPRYFDDIFEIIRADSSARAAESLLGYLKRVSQMMRKTYANLYKCVFCTPEIPALGYASKNGVRAVPEKVSSNYS